MKRLVVSVVAMVIMAWPGVCQIVESGVQFKSMGESRLAVVVREKKSSLPMGGAAVFLSCGKDTLKTVSGNDGSAIFSALPFRPGKDSLTVDISFLGYKSLRGKHLHKNSLRLEAYMETDPEQLSEIIVKGDAVAMVVRGDTTIFNAAAYSIMEDENLFGLLRKLPGISTTDGKLYANGEPVSKILINGTTMFSSDIGAALEMVRSEDVNKVRIYDQHNQERLLEADTLGRKERVVDVETKRPVNIMVQGDIAAYAGVYKDRNSRGGHDMTGGIEGRYSRYGVDQPSYNANATLGHNMQSQGQPASAPVNMTNLLFTTGARKKFKNSYNHILNVSYNDSEQEAYSKQTYTPTEYFSRKETISDNSTRISSISATYGGQLGFSLGERDMIEASLQLGYTNSMDGSINNLDLVTDGSEYISRMSKSNRRNRYNALLGVAYKHNFKKRGRALDLSAKIGYSRNDGSGYTVDTSEVTTLRQWLTNTLESSSGNIAFKASYKEPLSKRFNLSVGYDLAVVKSDDKRLSYDALLSMEDELNSYEYMHRSIDNKVHAGFDFRTSDRSLNLSLDAEYMSSSQVREEFVPDSYRYPRKYRHLAPSLSLSYNNPILNISLKYNEKQTIPSVTDTRKVIDDSSPLFLIAGNPNLKQAISRLCNLNLSLSIPESSSSLNLFANYSGTSNGIARKTLFFSEDTYLTEYDYTASKGSQLSIPVNVKGSRRLMSTLNWSGYFSRIRTNITAGPNYSYTASPFITGEQVHQTGIHDIGVGVDIITYISKYVEVNLGSNTTFGYNMLDGENVYRSFSETASGKLVVRPFKGFRIKGDFVWNHMRTDSGSAPGYDSYMLNAGASYQFGEKKKYEIGFDSYDILNRNNSWKIQIEENYISSSFNSRYGTSFILSFKYKF